MSITLINSKTLPEVPLYRQVAVATGSKLVFIAGQVAVNTDGGLVGDGDFAAQVEQCYLDVDAALDAAGATFDDVAKLSCYLVDWTPEKLTLFTDGMARAVAKLGISTPMPPFTGIGVTALADPAFLVEVEATAILD